MALSSFKVSLSLLTQVVFGDEASARRSPVVAPELDPQFAADGDVRGNVTAAKVSQKRPRRTLAVDLNVVPIAIV